MLTQLFFSVISSVDQALAVILPLGLRIFVWGIGAGMATITVYACLSFQKTIASLKQRSRELRKEMLGTDLSGHEFAALVKENLRLSLGLLGRVFFPALPAAVPVLLVAFWIVITHGYQFPGEGEPIVLEADTSEVNLQVRPADYVQKSEGHEVFMDPDARGQKITLLVGGTTIYSGRPFEYAVPSLQKKQWWNTIVGSPVGYLRVQAPVDQVNISVSPARIFPHVPWWLGRWELVYFLGVFAGAMCIKWMFRIE